MGYTTVFGGELLFPSQTSYLAIATAVDVALQWPIEQQIEGVDVVADFLDINTTAAALNIDFPDARNVSTGNKSTVNNIGGNDFTVRDNTGGVIQFVGTGEQWVLVLTDNSTQAGIWSAFQLGAATTLASASALAGAGLQADGFGMLEQIIDSDVEGATPITVVDGDRAKCLVYTSGAGTANLPSAGIVGNNWFFMLRNSGSGTLNVLPPSGVIDGGASINLDVNDSAFFFTDGADYFTIGLSSGSTIAFDFVSIPIPGSGDFVLSGANLNRIAYRFTGALTGNRRIVVPNSTQQYWVDNQTSGSFSLEIDTAAGAGIFVTQGQSLIVYCDATDVINANSSTSIGFPITIGQGGTGATTVGGAQINLQVPPDSRLLTAGDGMLGGGDLTADRTFDFDLASIAIAVPDTVNDFFVFQDVDNANVNAKALLSTIAGAGITGVPVDNQIAVWDSAASIEGTAALTFDGAFLSLGVGDGIDFSASMQIFEGIIDLNGIATGLQIRGQDENDDGIALEDGMRLTFEDQAFANHIYMRNEGIGGGSGTISVRKDGGTANFELREGIGLQMRDGADTLIATFGTLTGPPSVLNLSGTFDGFRIQLGSLYIFEQASASTSQAQSGQFWVRDDVPNDPRFTDDAGNDFGIALAPGRITTNNSFNFNSTDNRAENFVGSYFDGGNDTITLEDSTSQVNWPVGVVINIIAPGSGILTITEGSGTTLFFDDGQDTVGGVTVTQGVVSIFRQTASNYIIWGSGMT